MEAFTETHNGYNNNTFIEKLENYCHFLVEVNVIGKSDLLISLRFRINCHNTETKMFVLGVQKNRLIETVSFRTENASFDLK